MLVPRLVQLKNKLHWARLMIAWLSSKFSQPLFSAWIRDPRTDWCTFGTIPVLVRGETDRSWFMDPWLVFDRKSDSKIPINTWRCQSINWNDNWEDCKDSTKMKYFRIEIIWWLWRFSQRTKRHLKWSKWPLKAAPHFTYRIYEEMSNFENYDKWYHDDPDQQISYRQWKLIYTSPV